MNMNKSGKSPYFRHIFANNFFYIFKKLFQRIWNQRNSAFFDTFLAHIITFFKLWSQTRKKRFTKTENVFLQHVLEFSYATINGSVKPSC